MNVLTGNALYVDLHMITISYVGNGSRIEHISAGLQKQQLYCLKKPSESIQVLNLINKSLVCCLSCCRQHW